MIKKFAWDVNDNTNVEINVQSSPGVTYIYTTKI